MDPAKGFIGVPGRLQIAALCARCHGAADYMRRFNAGARTDQHSEYLTSAHGRKSAAGDFNVATCTDCHGTHAVRAVKDPASAVYPTNVAKTCGRCHSDRKRMEPYKLPVNQVELYSGSVHGKALLEKRDLSAPACNDCHGNHGASPPGVDSVANACRQCHVSEWDLVDRSPHRQAFADAELAACLACHQHHDTARASDAMLGVGSGSTCLQCHERGSRAHEVAAEMRKLLQGAEGSEGLARARVEVHSVDPAKLRRIVGVGPG